MRWNVIYMKRIVSYEIEFCNSLCRQFYHNYEDGENCWCAVLNKKIFDCNDMDNIFYDHTGREFPKECPLENGKV